MHEWQALYDQLDGGLHAGDATLVRRIIDEVRSTLHCRNGIEAMLHFAIRAKNLQIVQTLLRSNAEVNYCDELGRRAIHIAAETGDVDILRTVVNAGSPINVADSCGNCPLHTCMESGHEDAALLLVEQGATVNRPRRYDTGFAPIHVAARYGMNNVIRAVIRKGGDVNLTANDHRTPLHLAVLEKHSYTARVLCECGADTNMRDSNGVSPFLTAVQQTSVEMVRALLPFCMDIDAGDREGSTALHYISSAFPSSYSQMEILNILIENGADITRQNLQGRTALHLAAGTSNIPVIRALLSVGAELNVRDKLLGETPLNTAAAFNHVDAIRILAEHGADVNIPDNHLMMPIHKIHFSRGFKKYESTDLLLSYGARVNAEDDRGVSPLMWCVSRSVQGSDAAETDGIGAVRRLVSAGAHLRPDTNRRSLQHSPLCWLTWQGHLSGAAFLVNAGWELHGEVWRILPGKTSAIEEFLCRLREISSQPSSLRAICRLVIRKQLTTVSDDRDITPMIERLSVPRLVKQFLTFELEGEEL